MCAYTHKRPIAIARRGRRPEEGLDVVGEAGDSRECLERRPGTSRTCSCSTSSSSSTSAGHDDWERGALDGGAVGLIQKPTDVFDLPGTIRGRLEAAGIALD